MWERFRTGRLPVNDYGYWASNAPTPLTVPEEFRQRQWEDFKPALQQVAQAWVNGQPHLGVQYTNLMFRGAPGNGKSSAAWLTVVEYLTVERPRSRVFVVPFEEMMQTFSDAEGYGEFAMEKVGKWHRSELLAIDDFGTRDPKTQARVGRLFHLLNDRWQNRRLTLISCNMPDDWIAANLDGERTLDRIKGLVVNFLGASFRKHAEITV